MAELVVGALLSASMKVLLERLASKEVLAFFRGQNSAMELLEELKARLISASALLSDAEEKQLIDDNVKNWLAELKDIIYEADRLTDSINTDALRNEAYQSELERRGKCSTLCFNTPRFWSTSALKAERSELEDIVGKLKLVLEQNNSLGLKRLDITTPYNPYRSLTPPLAQAANVYGRESEREAIVEFLMSDDASGPRISVIPIVGMGGIGKTTLAQLVYEDAQVREHFDLRVWVTVSEEFDVFKLTRMILEDVTSGKSGTRELHHLQTKLGSALKGKKFLCVLDDVWNENYQLWDTLKSPLQSGSLGSKIIVTTRSQITASKMGTHRMLDLEAMEDENCWLLFADHAFGNGVDGEKLREIGIEIVKKCKGLPLAVKAIAGILRSVSDPNEWRRILESDIWDLQFQENRKSGILPALWLSYRSLPPQLKRCFAYCSIFPKDYKLGESEQETLVLLWMAEGLLKRERGKTMEDVGREHVNELISRSLFQRSSNRFNNPILLMHDLVHDLAMRVSGEFCFLSNGCDDLHNFTDKTRHVLYEESSGGVNRIKGLSMDRKCLRTMVVLRLSHNHLSDTLLDWMPRVKGCFRALSLSSRSITTLPCSIGNLKHLRFLDLSFTSIEELPSSICTLYNLQTLLLERCWKLKILPAEISRLINLRHLDIRETWSLTVLPDIGNLTNLQTLSKFYLVKGRGSKIKELENLNLLRGKLEISGIENVEVVKDAVEAKLANKKWINELCLVFSSVRVNALEKGQEVLDALQPHTGLKKLEIRAFKYEKIPNWVTQRSFVNMADVTLTSFSCTVLPPFGQLPSLRALSLRHLKKLVSIGNEICGDSLGNSFPCLEELSLSHMGSLKKWSFTPDTTIFPRLKKLSVEFCPKLKTGFPSISLPALESADFRRCPGMIIVFAPTIRASYPSLKSMELTDCKQIVTLKGIKSATNMKRLEILGCNILVENRSSWDVFNGKDVQIIT